MNPSKWHREKAGPRMLFSRPADRAAPVPDALNGSRLGLSRMTWILAPLVCLCGGLSLVAAERNRSAEEWWAFQSISHPRVPHVESSDWTENPVDRFVVAELETRDLYPSQPAHRRFWIRRVTFDLTGLPPTPDEVVAYLSDTRPGADSRLVDRLLSSPAYGQTWARRWLDVARYADYHNGNPNERSAICEPLEAWRYRDWVVESFNSDRRFDQFVRLQVAGDLMPNPVGGDVYPDGIVATTFLANGVWDRDDADKEKIVSDMVDDQIDSIGKAFIGLSLGCARCHDHKFDPISQEDYYALAGIFYSTHIVKDLGTKGGQYTLDRPALVGLAYLETWKRQQQQLSQIEKELAELEQGPAAERDCKRAKLVQAKENLSRQFIAPPPVATAVQEGGTPGGLFPDIQDVPIHIRGSYRRLGAVVPRRLPLFFAGLGQAPIKSGSGRRELAEWLASSSNPLTARVIINRIWQASFGEGLVRTPNNFGMRAEPPSHPALLDWLSNRLIADQWSLKELQRMLVLSATYRQSSQSVSKPNARDLTNRWLTRFSARRLDSEAIRDAMLCVSGQLDQTSGGPALDDISNRRRSLYVQSARWDHNTYATLFDAANSDVSTGKRMTTTVAPQALFFLNGDFPHRISGQFARRVLRDRDNLTERLEYAYQLAYSRPPRERELRLSRQILSTSDDVSPTERWTELAHILICSNEFVYVD